MDYRGIRLLLLPLLISGCAISPRQAVHSEGTRVPMQDIYMQSRRDAEHDVAQFVQDKLREQNTYGYVRPYIPVVTAPVVKKVWVPDHKSDEPDVMVGGHWVYLMVEGPRWLADAEAPRGPDPVVVPAPPAEHK